MENKNWWEQATMADHNKDIKGTKIPWYNQQSKLGWSILFWPVFVYGFFKTDLIKRKTKQIIGGVIAAMLFFGYLNSDDDSVKPPTMSITSYQLESAYMQNKDDADDRYKGKTITVSSAIAAVMDIGDDDDQGVMIGELNTNDMFTMCYFKNIYELKSLSQRQRVVITGRCKGKTTNPQANQNLIIMDQCRLGDK